MRADKAETIYAAEWPGFPGETEGRRLALADIEALDEAFHAPTDPDWLAISKVFKKEETAMFKEADESPIYDYEIETQRPVAPLEDTKIEKISWRQRTKQIMGQAAELVKETSVSAAATLQAKTEQTARRKKVASRVLGAVVLGGLAYMEYKGLSGSTAVREVHQAHHNIGETAASHQEHIRHIAKVALHAGDNPWTVTEHQLHAHGVAHPSEARIAADDQRLMKLNHINSLQALKLHVGDKLKLLKVW
jgi:hypothetical protein